MTNTLTEEEIALRKKQKKIDKNHWMCKIQKYVFNIDATTFYLGYCPFFWSTWCAVLAAPVVFLARLLAFAATPITSGFGKLHTTVTTKVADRNDKIESTPFQPPWRILIRAEYYEYNGRVSTYDIYVMHEGYSRRMCKRMELWFDQNPNWKETHLPVALKIQEELEDKRSNSRMRKVSNTASLCGSIIFKCLIPLAIICGCGLLYLALHKIALIALTIHLTAWLFAGCVAIFTAAFFVGLHLVIDFISILKEFRATRKTEYKQGIFSKIFGAIGNAIIFLHDTVKMTYKQECPMIIWGDETAPIEKR